MEDGTFIYIYILYMYVCMYEVCVYGVGEVGKGFARGGCGWSCGVKLKACGSYIYYIKRI